MSVLETLSDERDFRAEVARTLKALIAQIDEIESDALDARASEGNVAVTFERGGTFVLSQQTPTRELWLSANLRAWHFRYAHGAWTERDTGEPLHDLLSKLFSDKLSLNIQFHA